MSELNLKCPADFHGGIQDDWDNEYASMWAQVQSLSHNKMQYRKAWMAAKDENARLQSEVERLRGRCGELMDFCADKIGRLPLPDDRTNFANGRYTAFHEVYVEAQRLRKQAAESENGTITRKTD